MTAKGKGKDFLAEQKQNKTQPNYSLFSRDKTETYKELESLTDRVWRKYTVGMLTKLRFMSISVSLWHITLGSTNTSFTFLL